MAVTHVIGTRFNLGKGKNAEWTRYRGQWLKRFAAASVKAQTLKPALWVVLVDPRTPAEVLDPIIESLPCETFNMEVMFPTKNVHWAVPLADWLRKRITTEWMTFTRLDSDDALHPQYIRDIDRAFKPQREVLSFKGGYVHRLEQGETYHLPKTTTTFQTTVERTKDARTAYCAAHGKLKTKYKMRVLKQYPRWLVIRHPLNERKGAYKLKPVAPALLKQHFGFLDLS